MRRCARTLALPWFLGLLGFPGLIGILGLIRFLGFMGLAVAANVAAEPRLDPSFVAGSALPVAPGGERPSAVEREWRTRRWALGIDVRDLDEGARAALASALVAPGWEERTSALDALARLYDAGGEPLAELVDLGRRLATDPHPNVRAAALELHRAGGLTLSAELAAALEREPLPALRAALARALERVPVLEGPGLGDVGVAVLVRLADDPDLDVASAAQRALARHTGFVRGDRSALEDALVARVRLLAAEGREDELEELARALGRSRPRLALLRRLAESFPAPDVGDPDVGDPGAGEPGEPDEDAGAKAARAWRAVFESLSFRVRGSGDADRLIDGWLAEPRRRTLLSSAGHGGGEELARALFAAASLPLELAAGDVERLRSAEERWPGLVADLRAGEGLQLGFQLQHDLVQTAVDAVGAERAAEIVLGEPALDVGLAIGRASDALASELGARMDGWSEAAGERLLALDAPAAVGAFALTLSRTGDPVAARLLGHALGHAEAGVREGAFRALCVSEGVFLEAERLHAAWRALGGEERLDRLRWLPRDRPLPPFRDDLVALGDHGDERRRVAAELLAPFAGDGELRRVLAGWLDADLRLFLRLGEAQEEESRRAVELRVQGELRALVRIDAEASVEPLADALARAGGVSDDIGESAAAGLCRSEVGRLRLAELVGFLPSAPGAPGAPGAPDAPDAPGPLGAAALARRARIEAAIGLASHAGGPEPAAWGPASVATLVELYEGAGSELRVRSLAALGRSGASAAQPFLRDVVLGERVAPEERQAALDALLVWSAAPGRSAEDERELARLFAWASRRAPDFDARRRALRLLGRLGSDAAVEALLALHTDLVRPRAEAAHEAEERALFAAEARTGLARSGDLPAELEPRWLAGPGERAERWLEARFGGGALPHVGFEFDAEIELARALGRGGRAASALDASALWTRLDGRLLLALAGAVRDGEAEARAAGAFAPGASGIGQHGPLLRAAWIALAGEPPVEPEVLARMRFALVGEAWSTGRHAAAERLVAGLLAARRAGGVPESVWVASLGVPERGSGVDPEARLAAALHQSRAFAAVAAGERAAARAHARAAEAELGASARARGEQERLLRALDR